jgi:hypothetical protein
VVTDVVRALAADVLPAIVAASATSSSTQAIVRDLMDLPSLLISFSLSIEFVLS